MAEHSDEVGETPASDSRRAAVSHLGRACVEAYRGEDGCSGGFGAEDRSLVWLVVSGRALRRWRCGAHERRKERGAGRGQNGVAWGRGAAFRPG